MRPGPRLLRAALRSSGLRSYWARQYPCLRAPAARAAAETHVVETLRTLPLSQRVGYMTVLRALPLAYRLANGGRSLRRATDEEGRHGMRVLAALPGFSEVVRSSTALALLGALDGRTGEGTPR
ncbi:hypothetical protein [Streptomyces sp. NPDC007905]|uniref:hypothetical protein n=1 Tax=Streptomyces sp. NPDC007905 TaxID=3364788 RepID=UPI0036E6CCDF